MKRFVAAACERGTVISSASAVLAAAFGAARCALRHDRPGKED